MNFEGTLREAAISHSASNSGMIALTNRKAIVALRERFCSDPEKVDLSYLRPVIARSWRRSILCDVRPDSQLRCRVIEPAPDQAFLQIADPVVTRLQQLCEDVGGLVCLTDAAGTIWRTAGSREVMSWADRLFPVSGGSMSEDVVGTNSEGTAIEEGAAVQVWGPEHFHESLSGIYCTSVPIRDPIRRNIRGVISLTLPESIALTVDSRSILMTVQSAAAEITQQILANAALPEQALLTEYLRETRKRGTDAVVAIGGDMTIASKEAKRILSEADYAVLSAYSKETEHFCQPAEHRFRCSSGKLLQLQIRPVFFGDAVRGTTIRIREGREPTTNLMAACPTGDATFPRLHGKNLQFRLALQQLVTAAAHKLCVHIIGEAGVGKIEAAKAYADILARREDIRSFTGVRDDDLQQVYAALATPPARVCHVFCHVDRAHPEALTALQTLWPRQAGAVLALTSASITDDMMPLLNHLECVEVKMPALNVRRDDIPGLVNLFIQECNPAGSATAKLLDLLSSSELPGNVGQLRDIIRTAVSNASGNRIDVKDLSEFHKKSLMRNRLSRLQQAELKLIREAILEADGNRAKAAKLLRIGRSTLYRKIDSYTVRGFDV
ncbi:sigma-54-dependent Fis family transcriptional regulator [Rhizobium leguminosarum]|uniref:sigma-54-dependent Fis family transcriptional regulator n=1 Tax=Rhizobium leguminosarum TaxID=384 RepID=UPI00098F83AC|nr:helix-turn-helix domain-containing protein [Rhizobium leguminosarum]ASS58097.1 hypothetical protein CHR56_26050 [Rhizobium leguminosarum bv. viciae]MBB4330027.1 transcriptional regulator of acetoin/glycerol metabolism [Rhizobium leguminosarum]MBB4355422.1 transcriptional regulator of acetoin/glycerol metabolism [Rhizobium leguminosarum]MBB4390031.1 transcriptional regulator of acetoin/glycerol metabolism [Rhizobium leguminosarum]MBB4550530.1 transcriptional regulator of acetoin/glycerol met